MPFNPADYSACYLAYTMNDASVSGTTYADASGNGRDGTAYNGPMTSVAGVIGAFANYVR